MKTKTEAVKILIEAGWNWDEVREVLEVKDKIIPSFDPCRDTYRLTSYGTYVNDNGETYSIPVYDMDKNGRIIRLT